MGEVVDPGGATAGRRVVVVDQLESRNHLEEAPRRGLDPLPVNQMAGIVVADPNFQATRGRIDSLGLQEFALGLRHLDEQLAGTDAAGLLAGAPVAANPVSVTIAGSLQSELGCPGDWQPGAGPERPFNEAGRCAAWVRQRWLSAH